MIKTNINKFLLAPYNGYSPLVKGSNETGIYELPIFDFFEVDVPNSIYKNLIKANIIKNPYRDMNSLGCEWVANKWWVYKTNLKYRKTFNRQVIKFFGIDYKAHIFFNGEELTVHEGQFESFFVNITNKMKDENDLMVIIEEAPQEMSQMGITSKTHTQKSRFGYKWDFSTRLVNLGIIKDVVLYDYEDVFLDEFSILTTFDGGMNIHLEYDKNRNDCLDIEFILKYKGKIVLRKNYLQIRDEKNFNLKLAQPKLWNVVGYGEQNLYTLIVNLSKNGKVLFTQEKETGFRKIVMLQNEKAVGALPYTFEINDKKVYIKGANFVPIDCMMGGETLLQYKKILKKAQEMNINLLRVWGGGVIEDEKFYSLCDELGIMVWQEFIQSSSGLESIPSSNKSFLSLLKKTSLHCIKTRQNHPSLIIYSGGNELVDYDGKPATFKNKNIQMLQELVDKFDNRPMLPTSASGPNCYLNPTDKGNNHDVHGWWKFCGVSEHYRFFNHSDSLFHSEFGVDGMTNFQSLKKFISKRNLQYGDFNKNKIYRHHGEWWNTFDREKKIFGRISNFDDGILLSQFLQNEGIRYGLEANRRRAFNNSGSIIWQLNEPYPNYSCTSIIDFYGSKKMACQGVKIAYSPINSSLKYEKLLYKDGEKVVFYHYVTSEIKTAVAVGLKIFLADDTLILESNQHIEIDENCQVCIKMYEITMQQEFLKVVISWNSLESVVYFLSEEIQDNYQRFLKNINSNLREK